MSDIIEDTVIQTDEGAKDGQTKCPKCGATDISLNAKKGVLRCHFCRYEFEPEIAEDNIDASTLDRNIISSGASDINEQSAVITLKCESCGAEVVIDTGEAVGARCHWCRNTLSINRQVPNGAVPDVVLPFNMNNKEAKEHIGRFVDKRKFFAHQKFKKEFSADNIVGVYLPYMVVDVNSHAFFSGEGEHEARCYTVGKDDKKETRYDAEVYEVVREFDMAVDDLTVISSKDKADKNSNKTNNIINSILPFDTENCVKWDANYIKGFSSEKRDTNPDDLKPLVERQIRDIARFAANETLDYYDRGVRWDSQTLDMNGSHWKTAYFPVWLYSHYQKKGKKGILHYVAVNARTKETMGSIPINKPKLFFFSLLVELVSWIVKLMIDMNMENNLSWLLLTSGFLFYFIKYMTYRNTDERHAHETDTKRRISQMQQRDTYITKRIGLRRADIEGANNKKIEG